jgi:hypothetical protein
MIIIQSAKPLLAFSTKYFSHSIDIEIIACHIQLMSKSVNTRPPSNFFQDGGKGYRGMFLQRKRRRSKLRKQGVGEGTDD